MNYFCSRIAFIGIILLSSGCGGGGTDQTLLDTAPEDNQSSSFSPPSDALSLQSALQTRYLSDSDFDVWQCGTSESQSPIVVNTLPPAGTFGEGLIGKETLLATGGETLFGWQALGATTVRTTSLSDGLVFDSIDYVFESSTTLSYELNDVRIDCALLDNTVAFGGASTDTSNNNNDSNRLESENGRIPTANRPVSAVGAATFDPIFFENRAEMVMTFPDGFETSCVDWDLVGGQPRDCRSNFEVGDISNLIPFSAGQTIEGTFGSSPNHVILTSAGSISLARRISSIYNIDSAPDGLTTGRYYTNGFTMTVEFNGNIYHTFAGISSEANGQVETLFIANRIYSTNF